MFANFCFRATQTWEMEEILETTEFKNLMSSYSTHPFPKSPEQAPWHVKSHSPKLPLVPGAPALRKLGSRQPRLGLESRTLGPTLSAPLSVPEVFMGLLWHQDSHVLRLRKHRSPGPRGDHHLTSREGHM